MPSRSNPSIPADHVHQRVHRPHLVQRDLLRRHAVNLPLGLAEQSERAHRARAHPLGERGAPENLDQLADVAVRGVMVIVGMRVGVRLVDQLAGGFVLAAGRRR